MGQLSNYTACLCVIKETCSVCSPGWGATAPLAQAVAQLVAQRVRISQEAPPPALHVVPVSAPQQLKHQMLTAKMQVVYSQQSSVHLPKTLVSPFY